MWTSTATTTAFQSVFSLLCVRENFFAHHSIPYWAFKPFFECFHSISCIEMIRVNAERLSLYYIGIRLIICQLPALYVVVVGIYRWCSSITCIFCTLKGIGWKYNHRKCGVLVSRRIRQSVFVHMERSRKIPMCKLRVRYQRKPFSCLLNSYSSYYLQGGKAAPYYVGSQTLPRGMYSDRNKNVIGKFYLRPALIHGCCCCWKKNNFFTDVIQRQ